MLLLYCLVVDGAFLGCVYKLERTHGRPILHGYGGVCYCSGKRSLFIKLLFPFNNSSNSNVQAVTLLIASFYKKNEQPTRNAIIFGSYSSIINGFLAWAVGHIPETAPLHIWQYLFLITGKHGYSDNFQLLC